MSLEKLVGTIILYGSEEELLTLRTLMNDRHTYSLQNEANRRNAEERGARLLIAESDRDNRRRRMDLARAILDETQVHDLDLVAEIIWPDSSVPPVSEWSEEGMTRLTNALGGVSPNPVTTDPTQVPSSVLNPNAPCSRNPKIPHAHRWGPGMEPECIYGCGAKLLKSQSIL
jgi:hypothetical protein